MEGGISEQKMNQNVEGEKLFDNLSLSSIPHVTLVNSRLYGVDQHVFSNIHMTNYRSGEKEYPKWYNDKKYMETMYNGGGSRTRNHEHRVIRPLTGQIKQNGNKEQQDLLSERLENVESEANKMNKKEGDEELIIINQKVHYNDVNKHKKQQEDHDHKFNNQHKLNDQHNHKLNNQHNHKHDHDFMAFLQQENEQNANKQLNNNRQANRNKQTNNNKNGQISNINEHINNKNAQINNKNAQIDEKQVRKQKQNDKQDGFKEFQQTQQQSDQRTLQDLLNNIEPTKKQNEKFKRARYVKGKRDHVILNLGKYNKKDIQEVEESVIQKLNQNESIIDQSYARRDYRKDEVDDTDEHFNNNNQQRRVNETNRKINDESNMKMTINGSSRNDLLMNQFMILPKYDLSSKKESQFNKSQINQRLFSQIKQFAEQSDQKESGQVSAFKELSLQEQQQKEFQKILDDNLYTGSAMKMKQGKDTYAQVKLREENQRSYMKSQRK